MEILNKKDFMVVCLVVYDKALESNDKDMLEQAIRRNVYGIVDKIADNIVAGLVPQQFAHTQQTWEWLQEAPVPRVIIDLEGDPSGHGGRSQG